LRTSTAAATDLGRKRSGNEDSYEIWTPDDRSPSRETLLVVCDGMGGSSAGEVASRMAAATLVRVYSEFRTREPEEVLRQAVESANQEVWDHARSRSDLEGMGTTCTALLLRDGTAWLAHVGDSRGYLIRNGRIRQLTRDHSLVAQLVERHQLTPEEAKTDPRRNVVTRSVGVQPAIETDIVSLGEEVRPGDTFLLCSDGLHGQVNEHEMTRAVAGESLSRACRDLVALANERGGPDNITVLLARIEGAESATREAAPSSGRKGGRAAAAKAPAGNPRKRTIQLLIGALIVLLLALFGVAWVVFGLMRSNQTTAEAGTSAGDTRR
jgi:protein phosphatase